MQGFGEGWRVEGEREKESGGWIQSPGNDLVCLSLSLFFGPIRLREIADPISV